MQLGPIVLTLRAANTRFNNNIGGAAELDLALKNTLTTDMAFVIPLLDSAKASTQINEVVQVLTERFGVVVALKNDSTQKDHTGLIAFDLLHATRAEIWKAIYGGYVDTNLKDVSPISYVGGKLLGIDRGYLWYQFEFQYSYTIDNLYCSETNTSGDGVNVDLSTIDDFNTIYTNIILTPSADLPYTRDLPLDDNFPDVVLPDVAQWIDFTNNPDDGPFSIAFGSGFDIDKT